MKMRVFEASLLVGMAIYFFIYESLFPIPLDIIALIVYSCTWVFKVDSRRWLAARCCYFGIWFAYVLSGGMSPTEQQIETLQNYESYNLRFKDVVGGSISNVYPKNYLQAVRLIAACEFYDFKLTPPKPIPLDLEL